MPKVVKILTQHSAQYLRRELETMDGAPDLIRIVAVYDDGSEKPIFTGDKFSLDKHLKLKEKRNQTR